ncbi:hypothetical protein HY991_00755 [Candidatus Micrarchaeota archaeon]|nr:hypothetical protein [Candidatus Micrarchaeota archaeon]
MKKYGYNFISQFSLKGALTFVKNLREKNQEVIPTETDERLCELLGVMFGDGCIFASCSGKRFRKFVYISGHAVNDFAYLSEYISRLFKELFHREVRVRKEKGKLTINIGFTSEAIFDFFEKLGMPSGEKKNRLNIPAWLLNSPPDLKKAFLRGLFDTDGGICLRSGNRVHFVTATQLFAKQVSELLSSFGFNPKTYAHKDGSYTLCLNGTQQVEKWISEIGFININHYSKYLYWKRFGCCPTEKEMPLSQRLEKLGLGSY